MIKLSLKRLVDTILPANTTINQAAAPLPPTTTISQSEQRILLENTVIPNRANGTDPTAWLNAINNNADALSTYFLPIRDRIVDRKHDSEQMRALAPEIGQAAAILVPSILSPNDLQNNSLIFNLETADLSPVEKTAILDVIAEHFKKLQLPTKLSEWLKECLYGTGAKPIMILPEVFLQALISKETQVAGTETRVIGTEAFTKVTIEDFERNLLDDKIYSKSSVAFKDIKILEDKDLINKAKQGLESLFEVNKNRNSDKLDKDFNQFINKVENIITTTIEKEKLVSTHDNPLVVGLCGLKKSYTKSSLKKKSQDKLFKYQDFKFTPEPLMTLDDINIDDTVEAGNPLLLELPTESVIPIFTTGSPNDHIGYFILINENGNPVVVNEQYDDTKMSALKSSFNAMFGKFGMVELGGRETDSQKAVNNVYEAMLNKYIIKSLDNMDVKNVDISKNPSIYKCMFRRLLENKSTRLVFVPTNLLIYYRFNYHEDGTGKSKLEDIKFIMSLKITLTISKILAAMDEAVVRQKVRVNFDDKDSNNLETMKLIKSSIIEKKMMDFTYNPNQIIESIAQRGLTIVPDKIPGLESFSVESENNQRSYNKADDSLMQDLDNSIITGLGPPHSAFNKLGENEYSRSLATTNLFFSQQIKDYQQITCKYVTQMLQTYITFSAPIKKVILDVLSKQADNEDDKITEVSTRKKLNKIIEGLSITLPTPNIAPDKASFEEFNAYSEMIEKLLSSVYSSELLEGDTQAVGELTMVKAVIKSKLLREYMVNSGFSNLVDIPDIETLDVTQLVKIQQAVLNMRKRLEENKKIFVKEEEAPASEY